jgi:hypothetical protein
MAMPTSADAMFYFYTNELEFTPEFMGRLKFACGAASLIGILVYNKWLRDISFRKMFGSTTIICSALGCTSLIMIFRLNAKVGISDEWFSMSGGFIAQAFAELNTMPILVLCCRICPKNIEGSLYALLMSTINLGGLLSYQLGGLVTIVLGITKTDFSNLWILSLITNLSYLLPLPLLFTMNMDKFNHGCPAEAMSTEPDTEKFEPENGNDIV